jgi:hypothetical protein
MDHPPNRASVYRTKLVYFRGAYRRICLQTRTGPCPLIAMINILALRGQMSLGDRDRLTGHELEDMLHAHLVTHNGRRAESDPNLKQILSDALSLLPSLHGGLDVNIQFSDPRAFEYTSAIALFDLCRIDLVHAWVPPPEEPFADIIAPLSYDKLVLAATEVDDDAAVPASAPAPAAAASGPTDANAAVSESTSADATTTTTTTNAVSSCPFSGLDLHFEQSRAADGANVDVCADSDAGANAGAAVNASAKSADTGAPVPEPKREARAVEPEEDDFAADFTVLESPPADAVVATDADATPLAPAAGPAPDALRLASTQTVVPVAGAGDRDARATLATAACLFLDDYPQQWTPHGARLLQRTLADTDLVVLFRNNHFSVLYKVGGSLYALVTAEDIALAPAPQEALDAARRAHAAHAAVAATSVAPDAHPTDAPGDAAPFSRPAVDALIAWEGVGDGDGLFYPSYLVDDVLGQRQGAAQRDTPAQAQKPQTQPQAQVALVTEVGSRSCAARPLWSNRPAHLDAASAAPQSGPEPRLTLAQQQQVRLGRSEKLVHSKALAAKKQVYLARQHEAFAGHEAQQQQLHQQQHYPDHGHHYRAQHHHHQQQQHQQQNQRPAYHHLASAPPVPASYDMHSYPHHPAHSQAQQQQQQQARFAEDSAFAMPPSYDEAVSLPPPSTRAGPSANSGSSSSSRADVSSLSSWGASQPVAAPRPANPRSLSAATTGGGGGPGARGARGANTLNGRGGNREEEERLRRAREQERAAAKKKKKDDCVIA